MTGINFSLCLKMNFSRLKIDSALLLCLYVMMVHGAFVDPPQEKTALRSFSDSQTRLPCRYQVESEEKVVQVTWYKELPDGTKDQMITAHFTDGHTEFGRYAGRVRFESNSPTENSALLIPNTDVSDEGTYTCHISNFPNGNFERQIALTVWMLPIASLEPVVLVENQSFGVAASCRAMGRPPPLLSWDTTEPGQVQNRSSETGSVSTHYSLHPHRNMNGKQLDCLVWHPTLKQPRRIPNVLEVHYPPEVTISTATKDWFVGLEEAELVCDARGLPNPYNITWIRRGEALPEGASVVGAKLVFSRPLRLNDSGVYQCEANNGVGVGRMEYTLDFTKHSSRMGISSDNLLLVIIGAAAGLLLLVMVVVVLLVHRHHRQRHKKLELELSEKTEEINNLSRQTSLRRLNSVSTDPRAQSEDYASLRVDSRMKNSQMSLERPIYKDNQGTLPGKWGPPGGVELDELGRPVVWHDGREMDPERRRRVESYLKSSNMSLDSGLPSSLVPLKAQQDEGVGPRDNELPHLRQGPSPNAEEWGRSVLGEEQDDDDDDSGSYQISEALNNHFYYSNGQLRPRPHSNALLLHPNRQGSLIRPHNI